MLKISKLKIALINHAHTVRGIRGSVMPVVREWITVTQKFSAVRRAAPQNSATLAIHKTTPVAGGRKNAAVIPTSEATVAQNPNELNEGNARSRAPICTGNKKLPNPAWGAAVRTMKTMSEPCSRVRAAYRSGAPPNEENRESCPGQTCWERMTNDIIMPTKTLPKASQRYRRPIAL